FDADYGYYPVAWQVLKAGGEVAEQCTAASLVVTSTGKGSTWVPLKVTCTCAPHGAGDAGQRLDYTIDRSSLQINASMDDAWFTLRPQDYPVDTVYNRDWGAITNVAANLEAMLSGARGPTHKPPARLWLSPL